MADEKFPKDYDRSTLQRIIEGIKSSVSQASQKAAQDLYDASVEIKDTITKLSKKVGELAGATGDEENAYQTFTPAPENLEVWEFGNWGFATVSPFTRWKYWGMVTGYDFYGTQNVDSEGDFEPHETDYIQKGTHFAYTAIGENGSPSFPNTYLNTLDPTPGGTGTHILDRRLVKLVASKRLILENTTTGEWGYIGGDGAALQLFPNPTMYRLKASRNTADPVVPGGAQTIVKWRDGDTWKIKDYPNQTLFSIGALTIFYKRWGNIYVKARTVGKGHSYSAFTPSTASTGVSSSEEVDAPTIVMPIHQPAPNVNHSCTLEDTYDYKPYCPICHRVVEWNEVVAGTRETDHFSLFGFEACNVEFVYDELDSSIGEFFYQTRRSLAGADTEDTADIEYKEGDVT